MKRIKIKIIIYIITILSLSIFLSNNTFADTLDYNVIIKPSLKLTLSNTNPALNLNPTNHAFDHTSIVSTVATNHPNGYKLYLDTATGSGGTSGTELVNTVNSTYTIPTLESSIGTSSFPANRWGYRITSTDSTGDETTTASIANITSATNYFPYTSEQIISSSNIATNATTSTLDFAAKIDYNKPAGLYNLTFDLKTIPQVSQTYMQDMSNPTIANQVCRTEAPSIVIDSRDEQAYMIQRLDDGKCWMLDNLNLDLTNKTIVDNLTTENTHVDAASLKSLREGNRSAGARYATGGLKLTNWVGSSGSSNASNTVPAVNKGDNCSVDSCTYTNNTVLSTVIPNSTFGLGSGKVGIYYNYCAASAGNYCYENTNGSSSISQASSAEYDICPAEWRMPTGGPSGEIQTLCNILKGDTCAGSNDSMTATNPDSMQYKLSVALTGYYYGAAYVQGSAGYFWSSTYNTNSAYMYLFASSASTVSPQNSNARFGGWPVRCLLQE